MPATTKDQLIADIRASYAPSYGAAGGEEDALHQMELPKLQALRDRLVRLARTSSQRVKRTARTEALHREADAKIEDALATLAGLEKKLERDARMPVVASAPRVPRAPAAYTLHGLEASWSRWVDHRAEWIDTQFTQHFRERLIEQVQSRLLEAHLPEDRYSELIATLWEPTTQALVEQHAMAAQMEAMRLLRHRMSSVFATMDQGLLQRDTLAGFAMDSIGLALEPSVPSEPGPTLSPHRAAEGLAKLQAYAVDYAADVIVVSDNGGSILGEFIAGEMEERGPRPKIWFKGREAPVDVRSDARFLILADVATDTRSIDQCQRLVAKHYAAGSMAFAALLGSPGLKRGPAFQGRLFVTMLSNDRQPKLPWDRRGTYKRVEGGHLFGGGEQTLPVPDRFLDVGELFQEDP